MLLNTITLAVFCFGTDFLDHQKPFIGEVDISFWEDVNLTNGWLGDFETKNMVRHRDYLIMSGTFAGELDLDSIVLISEQKSAVFCVIYDGERRLQQALVLESRLSIEALALIGRNGQFGMVAEVEGRMVFLPLALELEFRRQVTHIELDTNSGEVLTIRRLVPDVLFFDQTDEDLRPMPISDTTGSSGNPNPPGDGTGSGGGTGSGTGGGTGSGTLVANGLIFGNTP